MLISITAILVRIFGAWCLFTGGQNLVFLPTISLSHFSTQEVALMIMGHLFYGLLGILLWLKAPVWAAFCLKGIHQPEKPETTDTTETIETITSAQMVQAGSFLIGLYWVTNQLPIVINTLFHMNEFGEQVFYRLLQHLILIILALLLMLGNGWVARLFKKLQSL